MRRLVIAAATCVAAIASLGLSATAQANHIFDSDCAPNPTVPRVDNFTVTTSSLFAGDIAGLTGTGRACGTVLHNNLFNCGDAPIGQPTLNYRADIVSPPGADVNSTSNMQDNSYVGFAWVDVASCNGIASGMFNNVGAQVRVERDRPGGMAAWECPQNPPNAVLIACYRGDDVTSVVSLGHNYMWVTRNTSTNRYTTTIGRFHAALGDAGLAEIDNFTLCAYADDPSYDPPDPTHPATPTCRNNTSMPWMQKNGSASAPDCNGGAGPNGIFTVTVTMRGGNTPDPTQNGGNGPTYPNPPARACVPWSPRETVDPDCSGTNPNAPSRPYDNSFKAREFSVDTVDGDGDTVNHTAGANASLRTRALVCSTALQASGSGNGTITDHVDLLEAVGFGTNGTSVMDRGSYAGKLAGRIAYRDAGGAAHIETAQADLRVDPLDIRWLEGPVDLPIQDGCNRDADNPSSGGVAGRGIVGLNAGVRATWDGGTASIIFSCFKATGTITSGPNAGQPWHAWVWKTQGGFPSGACDPGCTQGFGRQYLTIGPIYVNSDPTPNDSSDAEDGPPAGLTDISQFRICGYLGSVSGSSCGNNTRPVLHTNGTVFGAGCGDTNSAYQMRAVRKDGTATDQLNRPFPNWIYAACVGEGVRRGGDDPTKPKQCDPASTSNVCVTKPKKPYACKTCAKGGTLAGRGKLG